MKALAVWGYQPPSSLMKDGYRAFATKGPFEGFWLGAACLDFARHERTSVHPVRKNSGHRETARWAAELFRCLIALLFVFLTLSAAQAQAQTFPKLTGRVVDNADILSPVQEQALTAKLKTIEDQSGRQMVVATLPDLQGYDIADYGYQLGRHWGIGQKEQNEGALLIVAPNDRKVRIEVGYGLEGILTDAMSSLIIQNAIIPRFKENDYPGGIAAGVDEIGKLLALPPEEARARALAAQQQAKEHRSSGNGFMLFFWLAILLFFVLPMMAGRAFGGRRYRRGLGPVVIWGPGLGGGWGGGSSGGSSWGGGGGFGGGGGSFGGGGASGGW